MRVRLLVLALALLLGAPPAAAAQSAGDEQYSDPFAGQDPAPAPQPAPAPPPVAAEPAPAPAPAPVAPAAASAGSSPATSAPTLPRTGLDVGWVALAGGLVLAAGLALRRRARVAEA